MTTFREHLRELAKADDCPASDVATDLLDSGFEGETVDEALAHLRRKLVFQSHVIEAFVEAVVSYINDSLV
jgi:hypothetical protein